MNGWVRTEFVTGWSRLRGAPAVVNSRPGRVFVLGHSFGGVASLEAAFLTDKIAKLVLYEPPLRNLDNAAILARMEKLIGAGDREAALLTFYREIVMISPSEIARMRPLQTPALLLAGSESASPELSLAIQNLRQSLPHNELTVFQGQEHNAMDTIPQEFAAR